MSRMNEKAIIVLIVLWFAFYSLPPTAIALPSSRSLKSITNDDNLFTPQLVYDDSFQKEGRMDIELEDYKGTGANPGHDPVKTPGHG